jgi:hypothetical protein
MRSHNKRPDVYFSQPPAKAAIQIAMKEGTNKTAGSNLQFDHSEILTHNVNYLAHQVDNSTIAIPPKMVKFLA